MSNLQFNVTVVDGNPTIAVFDYADGYEKVVGRNHPNFDSILLALTSVPQPDADEIKGLIDPTIGIQRELARHFGGRVTADLHRVYLDGIPVKGALHDLIATRLRAGNPDWKRLVNFLVNLDANPTRNVHDKIWGWIEKYGATITEDGWLVGYKGLAHGRVSQHSGPNNFIDGVLYGEPDVAYQVPHAEGTTISKRRQDVDPGPQACSVGLHVGSYNYALTFGENRKASEGQQAMGTDTFAIVLFNPADVVAVEGDWKIRVCSYKVEKFIDPSEDILKVTPSYDPEPAQDVEEPVEADDIVTEGLDDSDTVEGYEQPPVVEEVQPEPVPVEDNVGSGVVLVEPEKGTGLNGALSLTDWAQANPTLLADLNDGTKGHKAIARIYEGYTTESSVRRFRKAAGIKTTLRAKVTG